MNEESIEIGKRLRMAREILMLTQKEFADRIGMLTSNLSTIENGKRNIGPRILISIEKEFGVNLKWLGTGNGDPFKTYTTLSDKIRSLMYLNNLTPTMLANKIGLEYLTEIMDIIKHNKVPSKEFVESFSSEFPELNDYQTGTNNDGTPFINYYLSEGKEHIVADKDVKRYKLPTHGIDAIIPVNEDISPEIRKGDYLLIRKINIDSFIRWDKLHVIDTNQGVITSMLKPSKKPNDSITCVSVNGYDIEIPRKNIFNTYLAVAVIHHI